MNKYYQILIILILAGYPFTAQALEKPLPGIPAGGTQESLLPGNTATELYGRQGGYIHPYLTLAGEYTDNLFNVNNDEKTNLLTIISPGIWLALPRTREVPITITPHNSAAGGLEYQLKEYAKNEFNRFNAYLLGGLNFKLYSENSDLNTTNGRLEGAFRYNMKNGLSLQSLDRYSRDTDMFDIGSVERKTQRKYKSNLLRLTADWDINERLRAKADYGNFYLDYDADPDTFLDRDDNEVTLYGYFKYTEKSSFFINYDYIDVSYKDAFKAKDNEQHFIYVGWNWLSTVKTNLLVKLGYQKKNYDDNSIFKENPDTFAFELQGEHDFTPKTKLLVVINRKMEETDSYVASGKTVLGIWLKFTHDFSKRISALVDFKYEKADYDQLIAVKRVDDRYFIRPAVQYIFNDWFMGELAYSFDTRDSTDDLFDYSTNTFSLHLNFAL